MPLLFKAGDSIRLLERSSLFVRHEGEAKSPSQVFCKKNGQWSPVFPSVALPRWGYATFAGSSLSENGHLGPQSFIDENLTIFMSGDADGETLTYELPDGETYAYFAHPASLGEAVFTDTGNNFQGAWDGASWKEDLSNLHDKGPIEVEFDAGEGPELWYVYRTDWQGPSVATFRVDYPNRP